MKKEKFSICYGDSNSLKVTMHDFLGEKEFNIIIKI